MKSAQRKWYFSFVILFVISSIFALLDTRRNPHLLCGTFSPSVGIVTKINFALIILFSLLTLIFLVRLKTKPQEKLNTKSYLSFSIFNLIFYIVFPIALWFGLNELITPTCIPTDVFFYLPGINDGGISSIALS